MENETTLRPARTHGQARHGKRSGEYQSWMAMRQRCNDEKHSNYPRYGGRGVKVCERWLSFEFFFDDMGARPEGTSLDRINPLLGYEPGNCRWATRSEQNNNKRSNKHVTSAGQRMTVLGASGMFAVPLTTMHRWASLVGADGSIDHLLARRFREQES